MPRKPKSLSPALELLLLVWAHNCKATRHSWERVNHAMQAALSLAIGAGLEFAIGDFERLTAECRTNYWLNGTRAYWEAVAEGNLSAARAWEAYRKRPPFFADDVGFGDWPRSSYLHGGPQGRKRERLAVGMTFAYRGYQPKVTSIGRDHVVACTYHKAEGNRSGRRRIHKRFRVTADDLKRDRAERKRREEIHNGALELSDAARAAFVKRLKHPRSEADFMRLPLKRIEAAWAHVMAMKDRRTPDGD